MHFDPPADFAPYFGEDSTHNFDPGNSASPEIDSPTRDLIDSKKGYTIKKEALAKKAAVAEDLADLLRGKTDDKGVFENLTFLGRVWGEISKDDKNLVKNVAFLLKRDKIDPQTACRMLKGVKERALNIRIPASF